MDPNSRSNDHILRSRLRSRRSATQPGYIHRTPATHTRRTFVDVVRPISERTQNGRTQAEPLPQAMTPPIAHPPVQPVTRHIAHHTKAPSRPYAARAPRRKSAASRIVRPALHALAVLLILGGVWLGWQGLQANEQVEEAAREISSQNEVAGTTTNVPTETKTTNLSDYQVAPDMPRFIRISKLGTEARVLRVGVRADNQLAAPASIFDAGWYEGSSKPGQAGAALIDGHVSGPTQNGVFYGLEKLSSGDAIEIELGSGKKIRYKVVRSKTYDANRVDMAAALVPVTSGKNGLNLISCEGEVDTSGRHFTERIVVFAEQV